MDLHHVRKFASRLELKMFRHSNSHYEGVLKSKFRGTGLQFKEHKIYVNGDDVRHIDWKLSARSQSTFIKTFEEERNIEYSCFLDLTPGGTLGFWKTSINQVLIECCCLLYLMADKNGDHVNVVILIGNQVIPVAKSQGEKGIYLLLKTLEQLGVLSSQGYISRDLQLYANKNKENDEDQKIKKSLLGKVKKNRPCLIFSDLSGEILDEDLIIDISKRCKTLPFFPFIKFGQGELSAYSFISSSSLTPVSGRGEGENMIAELSKKIPWKSLLVDENYLQNFFESLKKRQL